MYRCSNYFLFRFFCTPIIYLIGEKITLYGFSVYSNTILLECLTAFGLSSLVFLMADIVVMKEFSVKGSTLRNRLAGLISKLRSSYSTVISLLLMASENQDVFKLNDIGSSKKTMSEFERNMVSVEIK